MTPLLTLDKLSLIYHSPDSETLAVDKLSFEVHEGELLAIVGPSGCGKSTLLSLLSGLLAPSDGEILLRGKPIRELKNATALMPQRDQLFEWRTILKNVVLGLEIQKKLTPEKTEEAKNLLEKYGLGDCLNKKPSELSGGMRQRAALIRTLMTGPEILLLDEPFGALDFQTRLRVVDDVENIIRSEKKTAILVTHDISEAISVADRILVLSARPATVKSVLNIDLDKDATPLKRREDKRFSQFFDRVWRDLENE